MGFGQNIVIVSAFSALLLACGADDAAEATPIASCVDPACTSVQPTETPPAPTATDGKKDGTETDIDCGGANAPRCADGKGCATGADCTSQVCKEGVCQTPRPDDGVKNGEETDIDCGGPNVDTPRCAPSKDCKLHTDCESDGCAHDEKCAIARSCAGHFGGDTCGAGEVGEAAAKHESCCATAPISADANATLLDKYVITAGRMRQFIERTNGNIRQFTESLTDNENWKPTWNALVPSTIEEANYLLGPTGHASTPARAGCDLGPSRGRTYWMSDAENDVIDTGHHAFTKDILDQKALNCVEFFMLQALCIWDGGRLATQAEIKTAWQGGENRVYPWGDDWNPDNVVWKSSYQFPEIYDQGNFIYVAAPGRRPAGLGKFGHADLAGLVYEITSDVSGGKVVWSGNGTWEGHTIEKNGNAYGSTEITRAYWATGGRCAHPK